MVSAGKDPGKITSVTQQRRKLLTDHPKKAFFTLIFTLGISCDQIAKIIWASVRGGQALAAGAGEFQEHLESTGKRSRTLNRFLEESQDYQ